MLIYKYTHPAALENARPVGPGSGVAPGKATGNAQGNTADTAQTAQAVGMFGPAYVRETEPNGQEIFAVYTATGNMADSLKKREKGVDGKELSESDEELLQKLKSRDAKVRSHEAAHVMAAGGQASSPTYTYQTGPDGRRYAIGGSVDISIMTTGDGEADARRAKKAYRAAMATGEPSARDLQTATRAQSMSAKSMKDAAARYADAQDGFY